MSQENKLRSDQLEKLQEGLFPGYQRYGMYLHDKKNSQDIYFEKDYTDGYPDGVKRYGMPVRCYTGHQLKEMLGEKWATLVKPILLSMQHPDYSPAKASLDADYFLGVRKLDELQEELRQYELAHKPAQNAAEIDHGEQLADKMLRLAKLGQPDTNGLKRNLVIEVPGFNTVSLKGGLPHLLIGHCEENGIPFDAIARQVPPSYEFVSSAARGSSRRQGEPEAGEVLGTHRLVFPMSQFREKIGELGGKDRQETFDRLMARSRGVAVSISA